MRHRKRGRYLGRSPSHRRAMLKNLACSLILTEKDFDDSEPGKPKVKGRVITTLEKAKEVRSLVEKSITVAKRSLPAARDAKQFATDAARKSDAWIAWRKSEKWEKWAKARGPVVAARRRVLQLLGNKEAVKIVFGQLAERFEDRPGGYTRVLRLAKPRLGDAGRRAILEFVGVRDKVPESAPAPTFDRN